MHKSGSLGPGPALLGAAIGAFISFLFRPAAPLVGQLPFGVVITRGVSLKGLDSMLVPYAESSFNIMIVGMILGGIIGAVIGSLLSKTNRAPSASYFDSAESKNCPACAETIKYEAKVCKHCGYEFSEQDLKRQMEEREQLLKHDEYAFTKLPEYRLLEIAYDYQHNQDNLFKAKYYLERLLKEYPKGEYIEVAKERLVKIRELRPQLFIQSMEVRGVGPSKSAGTSPVTSNPEESGTVAPAAITCPSCRESLSATAKFCHNCGEALEKPRIPACPQCGKPVTPGAQFCGGCGSKLM
jgi:predicted amidophosphoribosyltransferase